MQHSTQLSETQPGRQLRGTTRLIGILGWPVEHSLSPRMHNAALQQMGLDIAYVPLPCKPENLADAVRGLRALGFLGANVTIPHKEAIIPLLDGLSPLSQMMGTVNTLYWEEGKLMGTTTDPWGATANLEQAGFVASNQAVALLGTGGAARAIAFGLATAAPQIKLTLCHRQADQAQAQRLASEVSSKSGVAVQLGALEGFSQFSSGFDLVINATPVGMHPHEEASPIAAEALHPHQWVFDIVYNPRRTKLLQLAQQKGCRTVEGLGMLLHQGARSLELWTGKKPPVEVMAQALAEA